MYSCLILLSKISLLINLIKLKKIKIINFIKLKDLRSRSPDQKTEKMLAIACSTVTVARSQ